MLIVLEQYIWYKNNAYTHCSCPVVWHAHFLIWIFMNINETLEVRKLRKVKGITSKITYISAANQSYAS